MKTIPVSSVTEAVAALCVSSNTQLGQDIRQSLESSLAGEEENLPRHVLKTLLENADIAKEEQLPLCQDTGMAVIFVEMGQEVSVSGGTLALAIQEGVALGYRRGYLRCSVVRDPIDRVNTGDNTPAVIHYDIVPGDRLRITVAPKGFGSENMSALKMLTPADGMTGVERFILDTVRAAGPNPCPPIVVGVGVGGTMEKAALLSKQALLRKVGSVHEQPFWADAERRLLREINGLGIGPAGLGGKTTALAVHIGVYPTHIAGLPVAVNISCHVTRHQTVIL